MWTRCGSRISPRPPEVARLPPSLFDVEQFRAEPRRLAVARDGRPGRRWCSAAPSRRSSSTRPPCGERDVELARRRGGGGAVYLGPGEQLWLDAWIPRDDPLWVADVSAAAEWVGAWWMEALAGARAARLRRPHAAARCRATLGDLVCFAGRGPGEVFHGAAQGGRALAVAGAGGRAVLLLRVPALGSGAAAGADGRRRATAPAELARDLAPMAVGLAELDPPVADLARRPRGCCCDSFPAFG